MTRLTAKKIFDAVNEGLALAGLVAGVGVFVVVFFAIIGSLPQ